MYISSHRDAFSIFVTVINLLNFALISSADEPFAGKFFDEKKKIYYRFECLDVFALFIDFREKVRQMFYHAYDGYLTHAYPLDELVILL